MADYRALAELRFQIRHFLHFSEQAVREAGLVPQQHQLLLALKGLPAGRKATISEVAERLQLRHHSTVELIDRLVGRGLIKRLRDEARSATSHHPPHSQGEQLFKNFHSYIVTNSNRRDRLRSYSQSAYCRQTDTSEASPDGTNTTKNM